MIRVMVVEDSPVVSELVVQALESDPEIRVVGIVAAGDLALGQARLLQPDVITMDLQLPGMSGLDATREIMRARPTPIIVLTSLNDGREADIAFHSLAAGALTVIDKPESFMGPQGELFAKLLVQQVKTFSRARTNLKPVDSGVPAPGSLAAETRAVAGPQERVTAKVPVARPFDVVGVGASAGGPVCLVRLLSALPADFPFPIVLVQHISRGFLQGFLEWLSAQVKRSARVAIEGTRPQAGWIYSSREDLHLGFARDGTFVYSDAPPMCGHRPSVDALFSSMASAYRSRAVGVLLTGMGSDGAQGLKKVRALGGLTFAQDETSSLVFGMPQEALKVGAVDRVDSLESIGQSLAALGSTRPKLIP
jgi:two-component system chemotaxis response regulator CheB